MRLGKKEVFNLLVTKAEGSGKGEIISLLVRDFAERPGNKPASFYQKVKLPYLIRARRVQSWFESFLDNVFEPTNEELIKSTKAQWELQLHAPGKKLQEVAASLLDRNETKLARRVLAISNRLTLT